MFHKKQFILAALAIFFLSSTVLAHRRKGKILSIFNIVKFKNSGCTSTSTHSGSSQYRNGTCFTSSECTSKGGAAAGSCAAGFGTCCVFTTSSSGATITQNCTYIQNPSYPSTTSSAGSVKYTVSKCSDNVCALRLDFETFTLRGPGVTTEASGGACPDTFALTSTDAQDIPSICGKNTGQHIYVEFGTKSSDTVSLDFTLSGTTTSRSWEIKATQIPCGASWRNPEGCLQWHTGLQGRMTTFNFIATDESHLASQDYQTCIRQEQGYCCVQYFPCSDTNSFSIDHTKTNQCLAETSCTGDYITLDSSSDQCRQMSNAMVTTKYCGGKLAPCNLKTASYDFPICDCTAPFYIGVKTDAAVDATQTKSRGVCLTWKQIPCA